MLKYDLPAFFAGKIERETYRKWLQRNVVVHIKRDRTPACSRND